MSQKHNLRAPFGFFWNWCLNAPWLGSQMEGEWEGKKRVHCDPHVDFKNLALGVCIVFVFGVFNHREKAWLVIWEANVFMELPPGAFILYSSSLFFHFNVDLRSKIEIVTTDGSFPTPENSTPLPRPDEISEEDWEAGNGRGSVVWFNQASMFQTSETGYDTLIKARADGHSGATDRERWLTGKEEVFPTFHTAAGPSTP